jgi:hypothetical protein
MMGTCAGALKAWAWTGGYSRRWRTIFRLRSWRAWRGLKCPRVALVPISQARQPKQANERSQKRSLHPCAQLAFSSKIREETERGSQEAEMYSFL